MDRIIFHIDVNSAFLSWTAVDICKKDPSAIDLRTIPSIIGGDQQSRHGIVLAKSTPAKKYNIQTAEPIAMAMKKCPFLVVHPSNFEVYREASHKFVDFLCTLTDQVQQVSIDECYLDFTDIASNYESPIAAAEYIRNTIYESFGFTVNVGISSNKLLAKMASDFEKPNKTHTLFPWEIKEKMWPLPVSDLYMAGRASVEILKKLEILTIGDLAATDPNVLALHLKSHGQLLWEYANGIDDSPVENEPSEAKGVGNSVTLPEDLISAAAAKDVLKKLAEKVAGRLKAADQCAANLCVEIKYHTFVSVSHQMVLHSPTMDRDKIYQYACELFDTLWDETPIRLLGIRTSKLVSPDEPAQLNMFDLDYTKIKQDNKKQKLEEALQGVRKKYGDDVIKRGTPEK